jgi:hypothetical protein
MKTVILSTDDNQDYLGYLPYVQVAWNLLGWNTLTFYIGDKNLESSEKNKIIQLNPVQGFRNATVLQVSRLFGAQHTQGLVMTSDVDMIPLSNYWNPKDNEWTVYGEDLTNYKHYPICYISAPDYLWNQLITEKSIEELLNKYKQSKSNSFDEWWYVDQDIITERLRPQKPTSINRGYIYHGIAKGRIDRIAWSQTSNIKEVKVDAHMPRPFDQKAASDLILKYLMSNK